MAKASSTKIILVLILVVPLVIVAFLYFFSSPVYQKVPFVYQQTAAGDSTYRTLPDSLVLVKLNGDTLRSADLRGKMLLLNFFSTQDDSASRRTVLHGNVKRTYDNVSWEDRPEILFLSISTGDSLADLLTYEKRMEAEEVDAEFWPIVYADQEMVYRLGGEALGFPRLEQLGPEFAPYTDFNIALIDKEGRLRSYFVGTNLGEERKIQETLVALWRLEYADEIGSEPMRTLD
jgi:hypothetical protein